MRAQAESRGPLSILSENKNNHIGKEKGQWESGGRITGLDTFEFSTRLRLNDGDGENISPNIGNLRFECAGRGVNSELSIPLQSGESQTVGVRRKV